jgi:hypothetical protein
MFEPAVGVVEVGSLQRSGKRSTGRRNSFSEGNFEEVAGYSGRSSGHKYQFSNDLGTFREDSAKFLDQTFTRQLIARPAAFSENALLNSDAAHSRLIAELLNRLLSALRCFDS